VRVSKLFNRQKRMEIRTKEEIKIAYNETGQVDTLQYSL